MRRTVLHRASFSAAVVIVFSACLLLTTTPAAAEDPHSVPPGWRLYDGGAHLEPDALPGGKPVELAIEFFAVGTPPVRWRTDQSPTVTVCTVQSNRPSYLTAEEFRDSVALGAQVWSEAEAAVGFNYTGDCAIGAWTPNNGTNEIGWDDQRNLVRDPAAGVTFGRWSDRFISRDFQETDIVLDHQMTVSRTCLDSVVAHEMGHALGFGHSDTRGDLMYPSFDPSDDGTCPGRPTASEITLLRGLYGTNRLPTIASSSLDQSASAGRSATVSVDASDLDGDSLSYTWTQTSGPSVAISATGPSITFSTPDAPGTSLRFRVTAKDRFLHAAAAEVVVRILEADAPPTDAPYLEGLRYSADRTRLALKFTEATGATQYRYCVALTAFATPSCQLVDQPIGEITWDTVLGAAVENEPTRIITTGTRSVSMRACNAEGCIEDEQTKILAGGVRWSAHRVDYDYFTMTQDLGPGDNKFTIAFVQNMSGAARRFSLYSGTAADPHAKLMLDCGTIIPGDVCVAFLAPGDRGHGSHVTIRSERNGTPVIENRIRVR